MAAVASADMPVNRAAGSRFVVAFGAELRRVRRNGRVRIAQLATDTVPARTLKDVERGRVDLTRSLMTFLASRYAVDLGGWLPHRAALRVTSGEVTIDGRTERIEDPTVSGTLQAYLRLVRSLRPQGHEEPIPLRRDDMLVLAEHLDVACATVVGRLAELMDARGAETRAIFQLYLGGASVVGVANAHG